MIGTIRANNQSALLFFNTIAECEAFYEILKNSGRGNSVQIFDDTSQPGQEKSEGLKKSQKAAILHAANPQMITLTTAAGSRGADFHDVSVGIVAAPSMSRVVDQKAGRIARNAQFGTVYEVYSMDQLDESTQQLLTGGAELDPGEESSDHEKANLRVGLDSMEASLQEQSLQQLNARTPIDEFKDKVQKEYAEMKHKSPKWGSFFNTIKPGKDLAALQAQWDEVKQTIKNEIKP